MSVAFQAVDPRERTHGSAVFETMSIGVLSVEFQLPGGVYSELTLCRCSRERLRASKALWSLA